MAKHDLDTICENPAAHYETPQAVLDDGALGADDKERILKAWKADEEALVRASSENMAGGEPSNLSAVEDALVALGVEGESGGTEASL